MRKTESLDCDLSIISQESPMYENSSERDAMMEQQQDLEISELPKRRYFGIRKCFEVIEEPGSGSLGVAYLVFVSFLIVLSALMLCISTIPSLEKHWIIWMSLEGLIALFFALEYGVSFVGVILGFSVIYTEKLKWKNLWRFVSNPWTWIDLMSFLPFFINVLFISFGDRSLYIEHLGIFRILRLIRLFKYSKIGVRVGMLLKAIQLNILLLASVYSIGVMAILIFGTAIYFAENAKNPNQFSSLFETIYFCVVTICTVGYGDMVVTAPIAKLVNALLMGTGLLTIALPSVIIGTTYAALSRNYDFKRKIDNSIPDPLLSEFEMLKTNQIALRNQIEELKTLLLRIPSSSQQQPIVNHVTQPPMASGFLPQEPFSDTTHT